MRKAPSRAPSRAKIGKLVEADGGTLLLDEIGALPPETQERLDRVLATGEVRPVGSTAAIRSTCGSSPPASRPLPDDFDAGLAERIGATTVTLPPLRERSGDIPALARHLLDAVSPSRPGCARCRSAMTRSRC